MKRWSDVVSSAQTVANNEFIIIRFRWKVWLTHYELSWVDEAEMRSPGHNRFVEAVSCYGSIRRRTIIVRAARWSIESTDNVGEPRGSSVCRRLGPRNTWATRLRVAEGLQAPVITNVHFSPGITDSVILSLRKSFLHEDNFQILWLAIFEIHGVWNRRLIR